MQRDANGAVIYGPAPAAIYPARPPSTSPPAQLQAYIEACQAADELRDAQYTWRTSAKPSTTRSELKTILLDALQEPAYKNLYQQYCNRSRNGKTYTDLYSDIHDLVKYDSDGVKSSTRKRMQRSKRETDPVVLAQAAVNGEVCYYNFRH